MSTLVEEPVLAHVEIPAHTGMEDALVGHIPRLRRYARVLTRDINLADDLVQDTLERGVRHFKKFRSGTDLCAWLMTIMHNLFINEISRLRRRTAHVDFDQGGQVEAELSSCDDVVRLLEWRDLERALQSLSDEQRQVIQMIALEEMSYAEVAGTLDVPIGTVMSRLSRGRIKLRGLLHSAS
ncbi:RNA polymerase RpoE-like sigma-24 subunit [Paraburkholderia sp. BL8N3]|nr:sigma-70 family RNA polymerase sigma factor [Paraburkholderia sp. BL8N3]TCK32893.1 RNA polymerase RpoE-like sigma-24 subunit [Paraburkholderia sp. BL8N3]